MDKIKLIDICNPKQWKTIAINQLLDDGKFPVYGANGIIGYYNEFNHKDTTVLITCRGATCGNVHISIPKSYINGNAMALDNLNEKICLKEYLYYFLNYYDMTKIISGSAQPQITIQGLKKIYVKVYSIEEQKNIIKVLNRIKKVIDLKEKQITNLDNIIKSQFVEMFGNPVLNEKQWKIDLFGNLGSFKNGMNFNKSDKGYKIRFLGVGDFNKGSIINNIELLEIINLNEKPSKEYMLMDKDIIFVRSNGSKDLVGRSTLIDGIKDEITYSGFCIRYRNETEKLNTRYLIELFQNKEFFAYLKKDSRGANINNINQQMLSKLEIILPPIELQNQFADIVKQIDKQKFEIENSLKEMQELYESLMEKYFG